MDIKLRFNLLLCFIILYLIISLYIKSKTTTTVAADPKNGSAFENDFAPEYDSDPNSDSAPEYDSSKFDFTLK